MLIAVIEEMVQLYSESRRQRPPAGRGPAPSPYHSRYQPPCRQAGANNYKDQEKNMQTSDKIDLSEMQMH